jgi:glycyl-tRNA synthetase (class II)
MDDDTVTLRDRDSLEQIRIPIAQVADELEGRLKADWKTPKLASATA